jgi:hypothetical protein
MGFRDLAHHEFTVWSDFREMIRARAEFDPLASLNRVIWRGQSNPDWPLSSAWERYVNAQIRKGTPRAEREEIIRGYQQVEQKRLLERFRDNLAGLPGMPTLEQLAPTEKVWAIGRHHGLTTPLLDWSEKPYLALFFAISDLLNKKTTQGHVQKDLKIGDDDSVALYRLEVVPDMKDGGYTIWGASVRLGEVRQDRSPTRTAWSLHLVEVSHDPKSRELLRVDQRTRTSGAVRIEGKGNRRGCA